MRRLPRETPRALVCLLEYSRGRLTRSLAGPAHLTHALPLHTARPFYPEPRREPQNAPPKQVVDAPWFSPVTSHESQVTTLQICTFIFNNFQDAPPATSFLSTFCIVAGGWQGSPSFLFSLFHLPCQLSPLECAVPRFPLVSPLECAVTKMGPRNSFRMRSYEKRGGPWAGLAVSLEAP